MDKKNIKRFNKIVMGSKIDKAEYDKELGLFVIFLDNDNVIVFNTGSVAVAKR